MSLNHEKETSQGHISQEGSTLGYGLAESTKSEEKTEKYYESLSDPQLLHECGAEIDRADTHLLSLVIVFYYLLKSDIHIRLGVKKTQILGYVNSNKDIEKHHYRLLFQANVELVLGLSPRSLGESIAREFARLKNEEDWPRAFENAQRFAMNNKVQAKHVRKAVEGIMAEHNENFNAISGRAFKLHRSIVTEFDLSRTSLIRQLLEVNDEGFVEVCREIYSKAFSTRDREKLLELLLEAETRP
jgi:hypothetical protein